MDLKKQLEINFNSASSTYENVASIQKISANHLNQMLIRQIKDFTPFFKPSTMLDVGCGTGYVTEGLFKEFPNTHYTLNDISSSMLEVAGKKFIKHNNFFFKKGDIEKLDMQEYDLIVSNLSMQWAVDLEDLIIKLSKKSKIFAFTTLLSGSFQKWQKRLDSYGVHNIVKNYPTYNYLKSIVNGLYSKAFSCQEKTLSITLDNPIATMRYLKELGANSSGANFSKEKLLNFVKKDHSPCQLDYKIIFFIITDMRLSHDFDSSH